MRPAFRTTYWQNYPEPFYPGHGGQYPVPGWGVQPVMAGPAMVGVGETPAPSTAEQCQQCRDRVAFVVYMSVGVGAVLGAVGGYFLGRAR